MPIARSDRNPKLMISLVPCELEFHVAYHNRDLRTSVGFESIRTNRCSVLFEEKGQITTDPPLEIHISGFRQESHISSEYLDRVLAAGESGPKSSLSHTIAKTRRDI